MYSIHYFEIIFDFKINELTFSFTKSVKICHCIMRSETDKSFGIYICTVGLFDKICNHCEIVNSIGTHIFDKEHPIVGANGGVRP